VQICSRCQAQSDDSAKICFSCGSDLREWSNSAVALKRMRENPRVNYIRIAVSNDSCPACRAAEGAYAKEMTPGLPVEGCSHSLGCRCFYQPALEVIYP
jgi:Double zinc ribbon